MSRLARILAVGAMLAMTLTAMTAVAHAQATDEPTRQGARRPPTQSQVGEAWHQHPATSQQDTAAEAQERYYSTWSYGDPAAQQALAQERYYSTWGYGDTPAPAPAQPGGQPGWLLPAIGVLAAVLALLGALAAMLVRRARGRVRLHQAA